MLCDLNTFKAFLRIDMQDTEEDLYDVGLVRGADRLLKSFVKRELETTTYVRAYNGQDEVDLALKQRPVQAPVFTGTLTNGAATFTGMTLTAPWTYPTAINGTQLSGTQNLVAGMPAAIVASSGATAKLTTLPINTTIASVDSSTQVTLSGNATVSGTFNIVFGIDVYLDQAGYSADATGAFGATTQMMLGNGYMLKRTEPDGSSKSGLIQRMGGGAFGSWMSFQERVYGGGPMSSITATPLPRWPGGFGNVLVRWTAGVGTGATPPTGSSPRGGILPTNCLIPFELTDAVCKLAAWMRLTTPRGAPLDSTAFGDDAWQQISRASPNDPLLGTVNDVVRRWRELSV